MSPELGVGKNGMTTIRILAALAIGTIYYMVAVVLTVYDGLASFVLQPIIGIILSTFGILICFGLGYPLFKIRKINEWWRKNWWISFVVGTLGFILMALSVNDSFSHSVIDPETEMDAWVPNPYLSVIGWFITLFAVLHFYPRINSANQAAHTTPASAPR